MKFLNGKYIKHKGGKTNMKRTIGIMALMAVFILGIVYAANPTCDFDQTETTAGTSEYYIKGSAVNLSITITNPGEGEGNNATMGIITMIPGALVGVLTFNTSDGTNNTYINTTVDTTGLRDDLSYTFTMTMYNESQDAIGSTCEATYIPDNTVPICTHSQSGRTTYNPEQTWTVTGTYGSSATIQFGSNKAFTMSETSDIFTYTTAEGELPEGTYTVRGVTNDGLNSTSCTNLDYVRIDSEAKLVQFAALIASEGQKAQQTTKGNNNLIILVVIGIAALWYVKSNQ